jgi:hypothetical protein
VPSLLTFDVASIFGVVFRRGITIGRTCPGFMDAGQEPMPVAACWKCLVHLESLEQSCACMLRVSGMAGRQGSETLGDRNEAHGVPNLKVKAINGVPNLKVKAINGVPNLKVKAINATLNMAVQPRFPNHPKKSN